MKGRVVIALMVLLSGCASTASSYRSRILAGTTQSAALGAGTHTLFVVREHQNTWRIEATDLQLNSRWSKTWPCGQFHVVLNDLVCAGTREITRISGKDGQPLWRWKAPSIIRKVLYQGHRFIVGLEDASYHLLDTRTGHHGTPSARDLAESPVAQAKATVRLAGDTTLTLKHKETGRIIWWDLAKTWPPFTWFANHVAFTALTPRNRLWVGLLDPIERVIKQASPWTFKSRITIQDYHATSMLFGGSDGFVVLTDKGAETVAISQAVAGASNGRLLAYLRRIPGGMTLHVRPLSLRPHKLPMDSLNIEKPGVSFLGGWHSPKGELVPIEIQVQRWGPKRVYRWRTGTKYHEMHMPVNSPDTASLPAAFGGQQPWSPQAVWFNRKWLKELQVHGKSIVGDVVLERVGYAFHTLARVSSASSVSPRAVRVMVVKRQDTGERLWILPHPTAPMILKAERKGGIFYIAAMVTAAKPSPQ
jgi:hypothetical protein